MTQKQMLARLTPTATMPHPALDLRWDDPDMDTARTLRYRGLVAIHPRGGWSEDDATDFVVRPVPEAQ